MIDAMVIDQLYVGRAGSELTDGTLSGMIKSVSAGPISIGTHGMVDDYHADCSVHGGADKALHQFPAEHYDRLRAALPQIQGPLEPGMLADLVVLSENILETDPERILQVDVDLTAVEGVILYERPNAR